MSSKELREAVRAIPMESLTRLAKHAEESLKASWASSVTSQERETNYHNLMGVRFFVSLIRSIAAKDASEAQEGSKSTALNQGCI